MVWCTFGYIHIKRVIPSVYFLWKFVLFKIILARLITLNAQLFAWLTLTKTETDSKLKILIQLKRIFVTK